MLFTADALISCELHSPPQSMIAAMRKPVTSTILAQDAIAAPPNTKNAEAHLSYPDTSRERAPPARGRWGTRIEASNSRGSFVGALLLEEPSVVEVLGELLPRQRVGHLVGLALVRDPVVID